MFSKGNKIDLHVGLPSPAKHLEFLLFDTGITFLVKDEPHRVQSYAAIRAQNKLTNVDINFQMLFFYIKIYGLVGATQSQNY